MSKVLVTGATGFVGRHLCEMLLARGHQVIGTTRRASNSSTNSAFELRRIDDMRGTVDWTSAVKGADCIVHLAARVHVMNDTEKDQLNAFRKVNVLGTEQLLRQREMQHVRRVIFLSTIKVFGDESVDEPITSCTRPAPADPYGQSKFEAENLVERIGAEVGFETVIVRPPLVYGPGVGGNFVRLLRMVESGVPLPFGSIRNSRSLVSVQNLCDVICECLDNSSASGNRLLVSDNSDVSTPDLVRLIASEMGKSPRLLPVSPTIMRFVGKLIGRSAEVSRLTDSLRVNIDDTRRKLGWSPPTSLAEGIRSTVSWYQRWKSDA